MNFSSSSRNLRGGALLFEIWCTKVGKTVFLGHPIRFNVIFQLKYELYGLKNTQRTKRPLGAFEIICSD